jgi:hypothetical protein
MYTPYNIPSEINISPQYLGYSTNNQYEHFPPLMNDGRTVTASWQPEALRNNDILSKHNIQSNWEYRKYLTENAKQIMQADSIMYANDVGFYKRYADEPQTYGQPYLYKSYVDNTTPPGYTTSDLKELYISREQLNARKISPVITQEELLKNKQQR